MREKLAFIDHGILTREEFRSLTFAHDGVTGKTSAPTNRDVSILIEAVIRLEALVASLQDVPKP
jgi:hypothetical protein